jgi:BMFP domain-containing protein YqiC
MEWLHDPYTSRFADLEAEAEQKDRQRRKIQQLEDRVEELEAQLKSVLHILEARGLNGDEEQHN